MMKNRGFFDKLVGVELTKVLLKKEKCDYPDWSQ